MSASKSASKNARRGSDSVVTEFALIVLEPLFEPNKIKANPERKCDETQLSTVEANDELGSLDVIRGLHIPT